MGQNCRCRPQALACVIICYVWLLTADVLVLAKFSGRDNTVKKSLYVCPLQLAENPNGFSSKALKMSTKYLLVTIIFSSLHWDGWREFSPVVKSPKGGGVYQRVQLTLWQIILKFGIVHSLGSYCEYWQSWKQSTNCQTMVAEVIAWVFNMITVLVLLTPCLALSNLSWSCDNWLCIW